MTICMAIAGFYSQPRPAKKGKKKAKRKGKREHIEAELHVFLLVFFLFSFFGLGNYHHALVCHN